MEQRFGKLVLVEQEGPEREFGLSKASVTLGRALSNDIVLGDSRASREHARLECGPQGCEIVDLGSSNGTRLNGNPVQREVLKPGDVVGLGSSQLRYEVEPTQDDLELTRLDSESDVARSMEHEVLPMAINETDLPRLVVFDREQAREVPLHAVDSVTIGRTDENDVMVDQGKVSRRHAEVVRKGDGWLLRDLGSTNGTWLRGEAIEERLLQDGDAFRVGRAQIVFKGGHAQEALTMADATFARMSTRRPVVFVPGLMGSDLWAGNERVWPSVKNFLTHPERFRYPDGGPFESRGIVDELVIVPNLIKQDQYNRLGDYLVEELGYRRGLDYFEFAYDWRQDVRQSARELARRIGELPTSRPVAIMSHSLGTLVPRY
ncbi:MAG: FHA domain-containing protein [Chloroflexi bacterium]|nr:MAG: FHA domain-containing protein [Chloroflexota bacterium]